MSWFKHADLSGIGSVHQLVLVSLLWRRGRGVELPEGVDAPLVTAAMATPTTAATGEVHGRQGAGG